MHFMSPGICTHTSSLSFSSYEHKTCCNILHPLQKHYHRILTHISSSSCPIYQLLYRVALRIHIASTHCLPFVNFPSFFKLTLPSFHPHHSHEPVCQGQYPSPLHTLIIILGPHLLINPFLKHLYM